MNSLLPVVEPNDPSTWGSLTPSTKRLNDLIGINPKPRRLMPSEIELLRQSKQEIAQRFPENYARHVNA